MKDAKAALKRAETLSAPSTTKKICTKESQGHNQVYGIRDHSPGIGIIDPGSRVTSPGIRISHFLCVFEGSGIELFRYFIINEKLEYFVLQGKRPPFRSIEKA